MVILYVYVATVLIETLWNVNDRTALTDSFIKSVLIETLWNVNSI